MRVKRMAEVAQLDALQLQKLQLAARGDLSRFYRELERVKVKVKDVQEKTHLLQKYGIETGMFIMLGYEGETIQDLEETVEHLKISNPDLFLTTVAYPIKGTKYYTEVETRVLADRSWEDRSDRDLTVAGRYSRRFYSYATSWMVRDVALNRANLKGGVPLKRRLKLLASAKIGRLGMMLTQGEKENQGQLLYNDSTVVET